MDLSNINKNLQIDPTPDNPILEKNSEPSLPAKPATTTNINTNFKPSLDNEVSKEILQNVEYKPSQDIVQEKTAIIAYHEQERMQKIQQKELLINLQKISNTKNTNTSGTTYSRNLDESAVMNKQSKDIDSKTANSNNSNPNIKTDDYLEDKLYINNASEDFFEEFLNQQKKKVKNKDESSLKDYEEIKRKKDDENQGQKKKYYFFEEDEIVDIDEFEEKKTNLEIKIENLSNRNKLSKFNQRIDQQKINPALKKALRKDKQIINKNKLKQKFHKK